MLSQKGTVLLVDDDQEILDSLRTLLELDIPGVKVLTASGGVEALRIIGRERPSVIVSDYRMQGMDGIEFLKKTVSLVPAATRLMMSAYADAQVAERAMSEANVALLVTKPFQLDHFVQVVRSFLKPAGPLPAG